MSQAQWGHGFHTGKRKALEDEPGYVGLFFLSFRDGALYHQGRIDKRLDDKRHIATLYSWLDGDANGTEILDVDDKNIRLYSDHRVFLKEAERFQRETNELYRNKRKS